MTNKGKMIEAIYAACLTKRATLVIFYLINRANQELTCFPSVGTIARECNMSTRTVQRALNDLEEAGFLERESRFHERGGQKSNLFSIRSKMISTVEIEEIDFNHIEPAEQSEEKVAIDDKEEVIEVECTGECPRIGNSNEVEGLFDKFKKSFYAFCHGVHVKISSLEL